MKKSNKGFTIIELIVVVAIISLLSGIVVTNVNNIRNKAKISRVKQEFANFQKALTMFYISYGDYPGGHLGLDYVSYCPPERGGGCNGVEPCLEVGGNPYCLTEFYKMDWNNNNNASYFGANGYYTLGLSDGCDTGPPCDKKIGCVFISVSAENGWGDKNIICEDCPSNCGYGYYFLDGIWGEL